MTQRSILNDKRILAVDDETDVLEILEDEISSLCPSCQLDRASTYEEAAKKLKAKAYDLVILDIMGVRGFLLLEIAVRRNFKVAMLTAHALTLDALKKAFNKKALSYIPKEELGGVVPFLEDVLRYDYLPAWQRLFNRLREFFNSKFGTGWETRIKA
jgi:DNA-binding NtrC family response regulator